MVPFELHFYVYRDVKVALQALLQSAATIQAQNLEAGKASLFTDNIYFRGHTDVTHRLLPTRLRTVSTESGPRQRFAVPGGPPGQDPREEYGDWSEEVEGMRSASKTVANLTDEELRKRDAAEADAIKRATSISSFAQLDDFEKRAAVRHYSGAPSSLMDISTSAEVAAFFATGAGGTAPPKGQIGMLWAIDLNFLGGIFSFEITDIPGGKKIRMQEMRDEWGDNKKMFEDQGIAATNLQLTSVGLPFRRPTAQQARFFSLTDENENPLDLLTEITWWSIIERRAYACAFIHDGRTYDNPRHSITQSNLLPENEELASVFA